MAQRNSALLAFVAEGFLSRLAMGIVSVAMPLYALSMDLSLTSIAMLLSVSSVVSMLLKPVMAAVADRRGLKRTLTVAIALRSLLCLGYGFSVVPWHLYAVRGTHGLTDSLRDPSVNALMAEHGGSKAVARSFAWYQTAKTFAASIGRGAALALLYVTDGRFQLVFAVAFVLSLLPLLVVAIFVREPDRSDAQVEPAPTAEQEAGPQPPTRLPQLGSGAAAPPIVRFAVLGFLVSGSASMIGSGMFVILATEHANLSLPTVTVLCLVTPFLALTGPVFGWLTDNVDHRLVLSVRSAANTLSSVSYLLVPTYGGFLAGRVMDDLGKAAFSPAWGALMAQVSSFDRRRRARVMSYVGIGEDAAGVIAPVVAGALADWRGFAAMLVARAGLAIAAEVYALAVGHRRPTHAARGIGPAVGFRGRTRHARHARPARTWARQRPAEGPRGPQDGRGLGQRVDPSASGVPPLAGVHSGQVGA